MNDEPDATDLKERFAFQLLMNAGDAAAAAREVMPHNRAFQLFMAANWPKDEYVLIARDRLIAKHGHAFFLPSLYDVAAQTARLMQTAPTVDEQLRATKLYADLMGMITAANANVTVNNNTTVDNRKVMIVRDHGTDDAWQAKVLANQRRLIAEGNATITH